MIARGHAIAIGCKAVNDAARNAGKRKTGDKMMPHKKNKSGH
jgi:hypothetical protein